MASEYPPDSNEYPTDSELHCNGLSRDSTIEEFAEKLRWGSFGENGVGPLEYKRLKDLSNDHLSNILITERHISRIYSRAILHILKERYQQEEYFPPEYPSPDDLRKMGLTRCSSFDAFLQELCWINANGIRGRVRESSDVYLADRLTDLRLLPRIYARVIVYLLRQRVRDAEKQARDDLEKRNKELIAENQKLHEIVAVEREASIADVEIRNRAVRERDDKAEALRLNLCDMEKLKEDRDRAIRQRDELASQRDRAIDDVNGLRERFTIEKARQLQAALAKDNETPRKSILQRIKGA